MTAWLKLVPAWGWTVLGGLVLAALVGLGQQIRISSLQGDLATERQARIEDAGKLGACRTTRSNLLGQVIEQNGALADLRAQANARAASAVRERDRARVEAQTDYLAANRLLQERTGGHACVAAESVIDMELGL